MPSVTLRALCVLATVAFFTSARAGCVRSDSSLTPDQCRDQCDLSQGECLSASGSCSNPIFHSTCCRTEPRERFPNTCPKGNNFNCYCSLDKIKPAGLAIIIGAVLLACLLLVCCCCICSKVLRGRKANDSPAATQEQYAQEEQGHVNAFQQPGAYPQPNAPPRPPPTNYPTNGGPAYTIPPRY